MKKNVFSIIMFVFTLIAILLVIFVLVLLNVSKNDKKYSIENNLDVERTQNKNNKKVQTAVEYLIKKSNKNNIKDYKKGNIKEMYTFFHDKSNTSKASIDYRYIGEKPNNYVIFNDELWRIIGIFTVDDEESHLRKRLKIVRNEVLPEAMQWGVNGVQDWENSYLNEYLNNSYYESLFTDSQDLISKVKYYLGNKKNDGCDAYEYYNDEKEGDFWFGNIAIPNASDYLFTYGYGITNDCNSMNNSWMYDGNSEWIINNNNEKNTATYLSKNGLIDNNNVTEFIPIRPVLYLKSYTIITSGNGSMENPYIISIDL